jgi:hypothetical protein
MACAADVLRLMGLGDELDVEGVGGFLDATSSAEEIADGLRIFVAWSEDAVKAAAEVLVKARGRSKAEVGGGLVPRLDPSTGAKLPLLLASSNSSSNNNNNNNKYRRLFLVLQAQYKL